MSPISVHDLLERAKGSVRVGDYEEAERLLKIYIAKAPGNRQAHLLMGATLAGQNKFSEAADEFNTLLVKNSNDIEALNNIAVMYRRQGKYHDALGALIEAIDIDPTIVEFHYNIGNIHKQMGNLKAASMAYSKVIELDPSYVPAYNNLGTIYDDLKEYNKAFNVFQKGLALDRNNPFLHYNYGLALEAKNLLEDAAEQYRTSLKSKPGWTKSMNNLGIVYIKQGNLTKAQEIFQRLLDSDPLNAEAWNNMGITKANQGRIEEAKKCYKKALELNPRYIRAAINLERILEETGNFAAAMSELENIIVQNPLFPEARNRLARLNFKMEQYPQALEQAEAALELDSKDIGALRISGAVQHINGKDDMANKAFEKIQELDPDNYAYYLDLADIYFKKKDYKKAEEYLLAYLEKVPDDRNARLLLGRLYEEMGEETRALDIFEGLSKTDPNDTEALSEVAELQRKAGSWEKALITADNVVNVQGKRATSADLSDLNKSLEFYETTVDALSSSAQIMWDHDIKHAAPAESNMDDTGFSQLFDPARTDHEIDEEDRLLGNLAALKTADAPAIGDIKKPPVFIPEETFEEAYEKILEETPEETPAIIPEKPPVRMAEKAPEKPPVRMPEKAPEKPPVRMAEKAPEKPPVRIAEKAPVKPPIRAPEKVPVKTPEKKIKDKTEVAPKLESKDKAEYNEEKKAESVDTVGLLNYLVSLADSLPEKDKEAFHESKIQSKVGILLETWRKKS
ncbi:MAG: tetratricopeptide repeat protein [Treponema sp.]|jgi:tetratricopeptide (TPR) repeat protein|nr:tetratricopeptide repeat protein [Treponema sp.]